jgi:hypothetical protein
MMNRTRLACVIGIPLVAAVTIWAIAQRNNQRLAGPATYPLTADHLQEWGAYDELLAELERFGEATLAQRLTVVREQGLIWVAPFMEESQQALYVSSLGLVERIYIAKDALLVQDLPFPGDGIPEAWRSTYARLRLGGTLFHELLHLDGELDEGEVYHQEATWYASLSKSAFFGSLEGAAEREYRWAIDSAIASAHRAAEIATSGNPETE